MGRVVFDDAYLGGERPGKTVRSSPNKVRFVTAVQLDAKGWSQFAKLAPVVGFTCAAIAWRAIVALLLDTNMLSDGRGCVACVINVGCARAHIVDSARETRELSHFAWVNALIANLKTAVNGAHEHFAIRKHAYAYLTRDAYRIYQRVHLRSMISEFLRALAREPTITEREIRCTCALR